MSDVDKSQTATAKFSVEAGRLVAGQIEREIRAFAFVGGLKVSVEKLRGFFEVTMLFQVSGPAETVKSFLSAISEYLED